MPKPSRRVRADPPSRQPFLHPLVHGHEGGGAVEHPVLQPSEDGAHDRRSGGLLDSIRPQVGRPVRIGHATQGAHDAHHGARCQGLADHHIRPALQEQSEEQRDVEGHVLHVAADVAGLVAQHGGASHSQPRIVADLELLGGPAGEHSDVEALTHQAVGDSPQSERGGGGLGPEQPTDHHGTRPASGLPNVVSHGRAPSRVGASPALQAIRRAPQPPGEPWPARSDSVRPGAYAGAPPRSPQASHAGDAAVR